MCLSCHFKMSVDKVLADWADSIKNPRYELWNSTSLSHLYISLSGVDGPEVREHTYKVAREFIEWSKQRDGNDPDELDKIWTDHLEPIYKKEIPADWKKLRNDIANKINH